MSTFATFSLYLVFNVRNIGLVPYRSNASFFVARRIAFLTALRQALRGVSVVSSVTSYPFVCRV